jgi:hypothetical protein
VMNAILTLIVGVVVALNLLVGLRLAKSHSYSTGQKLGQMTMIWALPLIGAIVVWFVMAEPSANNVNVDPGETHLQQRGVTWGDYSSHSGGDDGQV